MTVLQTWQTTRQTKYAANGTRKKREPLLTKIVKLTAKVLPRASSVRRFVLQVGGLSLLDAAAWQFTTWSGLLATGISLLVFDFLVSD